MATLRAGAAGAGFIAPPRIDGRQKVRICEAILNSRRARRWTAAHEPAQELRPILSACPLNPKTNQPHNP